MQMSIFCRQQLIAAVVKKRAAIARAHEIVIRLMEPGIPEPEFLSLVSNINSSDWKTVEELAYLQLWGIDPSNYSDIVDERDINKLCGYPLCSNILEK